MSNMTRESFQNMADRLDWMPGPWKVEGTVLFADYGIQPHIAYLHDGNGDWLTGRGKANAALIAAAPDLYEALKSLHDEIDEYQRINYLGGYNNHVMRRAREAMAKALGHSPAVKQETEDAMDGRG